MKMGVCVACVMAVVLVTEVVSSQAADATPGATPGAPRKRVPVTVSVEGVVAGVDGQADELVYERLDYGPRAGSRHKLSELNWDISGIAMGGAAVSVVRGRLSVRGQALFALTEGNGEMEDYDWFVFDQPDNWTHRSISDVDVDQGWQADLQGACRLLQKSRFDVSALVGFRSVAWKWSNHGGDYVYSSLGADEAEPGYANEMPDASAVRDLVWTDDSDTVGIRYEQRYWVPYVGVLANAKLGLLEIGGHVVGSPFAQAEDADDHLLRQMRYEGSFSGGNYFAYGVTVRVALGTRLFVRAEVEGQTFQEMDGDVTIYDLASGESGTMVDGGAVALRSVSGSMAVGYTF
jgi:outer membrane protease